MHSLTDFKNFAEASLNLFEPLTILLGRNGSGKTNIIEGIELLSTLAGGTPLNEITDLGREGKFQIRGGLRSCVRFGAVRCRMQFDQALLRFDKQSVPIDYYIEISSTGKHGIQLAREKLQVGDKIFFLAENSAGDLFDVRYNNFSPGNNPSCQVSAARSVLSRYEEILRNSRADRKKLSKAERTVRSTRVYLRSSYIFDPQPKSMREYERAELDPQLKRGGDNLSSVLFALQNGDEEQQATLERIAKTIQQIPEEPFARIGFAETTLGDVMLGFVPEGGDNSDEADLVDARLLSDGTLRMLAVLTAIETVPQRSRIIIEEFDSGLHPSRARLLVRTVSEAAERRNLNIVVTTHNPAFMDAIDDSQMESVLLCHHDEQLGASRVTGLNELDVAKTMAIRGGLGDFVTSGRIEQHLKPGFTDNRAEATREWLQSLF